MHITLKPNDDRLGSVDENNALVYPAFDALGNPIPVRSAVQVLWVSVLYGEPRFICLPHNVDLNEVTFALEGQAVEEVEIILESLLVPEPEVTTVSIDPEALTEADETAFNLTGELPEGWSLTADASNDGGFVADPVEPDEPLMSDTMLNEDAGDEPEDPEPPKSNKKKGK